MVVGGGDFVFDWVLMFESIGKLVMIVHRCVEFCVYLYLVELLKASLVVMVIDAQILVVCGDLDVIEVDVEVKGDGICMFLCDWLVVVFGFIVNLGLFMEWGIDI